MRQACTKLDDIDWNAVQAVDWQQCKEGKQAEFLIEHNFPWHLITRIGVFTSQIHSQTLTAIQNAVHKPEIEIRADWYY